MGLPAKLPALLAPLLAVLPALRASQPPTASLAVPAAAPLAVIGVRALYIYLTFAPTITKAPTIAACALA